MKKKMLLILFLIVVVSCLGVFVFFSKDRKSKNESDKEELRYDVRDSLLLNYGSEKPSLEDFCECEDANDVRIEIYFEDKLYEEEALLNIGKYDVKIIINDETYESKIIVEDKEAPVLELKELTIKEEDKYDIYSFLVKCEDNTHTDCELSFENEEMSTYKEAGTYDISVIARDDSDNEVKEKTKLIIEKKEKEKVEEKVENKKNTTTNKNTTSSSKTDIKSTVTYKYGVKITTTGSKVTYDRSTFNATTNDLKAEASQQKTKESKNINQILTETNKYRAEKGLEPLTLDNTLTLAANIRAMEMAWGDKVSHTRPDGRDCFTILSEFEIFSFAYGENIAYMQKSGTSAATWWRNSSGHYANMTNVNYTKIGIGVYKFNGQYYYVQLFTS